MTPDQAIEMIRETLLLMLMLSLPILGAALLVGLLISIAQAVTQVQEQTLSFVPKIVGMGLMAIAVIPWIVMKILDFSMRMFGGS